LFNLNSITLAGCDEISGIETHLLNDMKKSSLLFGLNIEIARKDISSQQMSANLHSASMRSSARMSLK
jgi:hypothetical protein